MQKIVPHLWFDKEAGEAAEFYTSLFADGQILDKTTLLGTPSGTAEMITIEIAGQEFLLLSAGPYFKFTPAVSFLIACRTTSEVDTLYEKLIADGSALMPLDSYPFSERYAWVSDRFGLSWQVMYMGDREIKQTITPTMMFVGDVCGRAEEAVQMYTSLFDHSQIGGILRYGKDEAPDKPGTVKHVGFTLEDREFAAMDSAYEHGFTFNEAISFVVSCETQAELDKYWEALSAVPEAEQCGWLKDKYGFSWQIVPAIMHKMLQDKDPDKLARVTEAFLKMKKFDIAELVSVYEK